MQIKTTRTPVGSNGSKSVNSASMRQLIAMAAETPDTERQYTLVTVGLKSSRVHEVILAVEQNSSQPFDVLQFLTQQGYKADTIVEPGKLIVSMLEAIMQQDQSLEITVNRAEFDKALATRCQDFQSCYPEGATVGNTLNSLAKKARGRRAAWLQTLEAVECNTLFQAIMGWVMGKRKGRKASSKARRYASYLAVYAYETKDIMSGQGVYDQIVAIYPKSVLVFGVDDDTTVTFIGWLPTDQTLVQATKTDQPAIIRHNPVSASSPVSQGMVNLVRTGKAKLNSFIKSENGQPIAFTPEIIKLMNTHPNRFIAKVLGIAVAYSNGNMEQVAELKKLNGEIDAKTTARNDSLARSYEVNKTFGRHTMSQPTSELVGAGNHGASSLRFEKSQG